MLLRLRLDGKCSGAATVRRWLDDDTHRVEDEGIIAKRLLECIFHPSTFALIDEEQELARAQEQSAQPPMAQPAVTQDGATINEGSQETDQQSERRGNPCGAPAVASSDDRNQGQVLEGANEGLVPPEPKVRKPEQNL